MTPADLIAQANADHVTLSLLPSGRLKLSGDHLAIDRWLGTIGQYRRELIAELSQRCAPGGTGAPLANDHGAAGTCIAPDANKWHHGAAIHERDKL